MTSSAILLRLNSAKPKAPFFGEVVRHVLRTPLVLKILGANALIASVVLLLLGNGIKSTEEDAIILVAALGIAFMVNAFLVRLALSPLAELERVATSVSKGQFAVRAEPSPVADSQLAHLTDTVNELLDSLAAERRRIQKLGTEVVSAQDVERARLSRELHDSIAQTLAAVRFQLTAASADATDDQMRNRLSAARGMIGKAMDEVRNISHSLHPRMAEDLGLVSALEALGRRAEERGRLKVSVVTELDERPISANVAATLFRVAQEALNAAEQTRAQSADILVYSNGGTVCLEVRDDRPLVDNDAVPVDNSSNGLSSIMDRVELSGGVMRIERGTNGGMCVAAELDSTESVS